ESPCPHGSEAQRTRPLLRARTACQNLSSRALAARRRLSKVGATQDGRETRKRAGPVDLRQLRARVTSSLANVSVSQGTGAPGQIVRFAAPDFPRVHWPSPRRAARRPFPLAA